MESEKAKTLESLKSDSRLYMMLLTILPLAFYEEFFDDEFDANRYANSIIQGTTIAHCLQKVARILLPLFILLERYEMILPCS
jgi:hypothetical protein